VTDQNDQTRWREQEWVDQESAFHFWRLFLALAERGQECSPRGQKVLEIEDFSYTLPPRVRFPSYAPRRLKLDYIKREFLWYLGGNRFDTSICDHASMWRGLVNADGSINSNYGQYVFGSRDGFGLALAELQRDPDSRRAAITILDGGHLASDTKDVPCTYAISFRIRQGRLNMSVRMRSQDAVFGMGNDAPCFSFIHEMMWAALTQTYPALEMGRYHHTADSFHVYERHFKMMREIIERPDSSATVSAGLRLGMVFQDCPSEYQPVPCPVISGPAEVLFLRGMHGLVRHPVPAEFAFTRWLTDLEAP
jgi:thymidylate synthase